VVRFDSTGHKLWEKEYGTGTTASKLWALRGTRDHGMLLSGFNGAQFSGSESALLYKLDSNGGKVWQKEIDYQRADHAHFLVERKSYGYYMGGHTDSKENPNGMMWLVKLDDDRNIVWEKTYRLNDYEHAHAGQEAPDGGCIMAGHTEINGAEKIWLLKVDSTGSMVWQKVFSSGDAYGDSPYYVINTREGGYAVFGGSYDNTRPFGTGWLIVTDGNGNTRFDRHFGRPSYDSFIWSGRQTSDGGYIMAGYTDDSTHGIGDYDMYVVKTDSAGAIEWTRRFGDIGDDEAFSVIETASGYIVSGYTASPALALGGGADLMIVKIDKAGAPTSTVRLSGMAQAIDARAYPNPASGAGTTIDVAASALGAGRMLEIVDRLGRTVRTLAAEAVSAGDVTRFRWDLADGDGVNVPAGLYFYRVTGASGTPVCGQVRVAR
jgi:hypothetical protein